MVGKRAMVGARPRGIPYQTAIVGAFLDAPAPHDFSELLDVNLGTGIAHAAGAGGEDVWATVHLGRV